MNQQRLENARHKLQLLDDRLTYQVRPRGGGLHAPGTAELAERLTTLAAYTVGLKEVLEELILALGTRSREPSSEGG